MKHNFLLLAAATSGLVISASVSAQPVATDVTADASDEIVVTGTRVVGRSRLDTASPVDVLSGDALRGQGTAELGQALANIAPSIDFPRASALDATDSIRPATLRGLSPDQTLVLLDGIRAHTSALLNTNGSVGRGAAAFDLNTIPTVALESVEVLRDGASAQYGSDAIAGVVNLRLRHARSGGGSTISYGEYVTQVDSNNSHRTAHDGETFNASVWQGVGIGSDGFLTVSADYLNRGRTSRGEFDTRVTPSRVTSRFGDPAQEQYTLFANLGVPVSADWQLYGHAGYQNRDSISGALPRVPANVNSLPAVYANGFTPLINLKSDDINSALGLKGTLGDWAIDINGSYGRNSVTFNTKQSLNSTYGAASQTDFYDGRLIYDQWTGGVDITRRLDFGDRRNLNIAFGVEGRREGFKEEAGEHASYDRGPLGGNVLLGNGAQGFQGFRPVDAGSNHRSNVGAYLDLEGQVSGLTVGAAGRYEHYSDFGDNGTGKLSLRYDFSPAFALRATGSTGFRAPSLQQSFYSFTQSTSLIVPPATTATIVDVRTFPATSAAAAALGAKPLRPEKSTNLSVGAVLRAGGFDFTVDAYHIRVRDQIALSENLTTNVAAVNAILTPFGVGGARFFVNGIRSTAKGIDVVAHYRIPTASVGNFDLTAAGNYNEVHISDVPVTTIPGVTLFTQQRITGLERGTPRVKGSFTTDWSRGKVGATVRASFYGDVIQPAASAINYAYTGQHTLIDLEGRVTVLGQGTLALGVDNLFDVYPDAVAATNGSNYNAGATAFPYYSPFGFNGRYLYARFGLKW